MKRLLCAILAVCLLAACLSGCGNKDKDPKKKDSSSSLVSSTPAVSRVTVTPAPVQMAKAVEVEADGGLNIRAEASTESDILGLAEDGSKLPLLVEKASDGWYQVEYDGKSAYVYAEYCKVREVTLEEYNKLRTASGDQTASSQPAASSADKDPQGGDAASSSSSKPSASSSKPSNTVGGNEDGE